MIRAYVERSGESLPLARAEVIAAAEALGGGGVTSPAARDSGELVPVDLPDLAVVRSLAGRLALARRCLILLGARKEGLDGLRDAGREGRTASVRRLGRPSGGGRDPGIEDAGRAYTATGGRIDLERPERRFWLADERGLEGAVLEEVAPVDRRSIAGRSMRALPFQRPVSLPPRYARAAVNLARVRPGDRVVDPFLGTGALLAEAGLLGARIVGIDRDPAMVRGALRNFAHLGLSAEELRVGDAGTIERSDPSAAFDALVSDPPYGRASGTGGEEARNVVERVVPRWSEGVRSGGRIVLVLPGGYEPLGMPWRKILHVPVRVHRSLTREFRVYERASRVL